MSSSARGVTVMPDASSTLVAFTWLGPASVRLMPIPTTVARPSSVATISASSPASLASPTMRSLGHLRSGRTPVRRTSAARAESATAATTSCSSSGSTGARKRMEQSSDAPDGDSHRRSRRPRPADWKSAYATSPSGPPFAASFTNQELVESISAKCSTRQTIGFTLKH